MENELYIHGYRFLVNDRTLIIEEPDAGPEPRVAAVFSPSEANQLAVLLNKLVPDDYGVRSDFRIPINQKSGLSANIIIADQYYPVVPTCLSLSGMFATVTHDKPITKPGSEVNVELNFTDFDLTLEAIVTRSNAKGLGLAFSDSMTSSKVHDRLERLVMAVQRKWIASCAV